MNASKLRPRVVLWWGIGLTTAGLILTVLLPDLLYAVNAPRAGSTGVDQGLLSVIDLIIRLISQVFAPLGAALIAASIIMTFVERLVGASSKAGAAQHADEVG